MKRLTLPVGLAATILLAVAVSAAPAAAPATYTAKGTLDVKPVWTVPAPGGGTVEAVTPPEYYKMQVETVMARVKSPRVLQRALDLLKNGGKPSYYEGPDAVEQLAKDLQVTHRPDTFLIEVSLTGPDKVKVQELVHDVLVSVIMIDREESLGRAADRLKTLTDERNDLTKQADRLAQDLVRFRQEYGLITADVASSEQMARLQALARQLAETQAALAGASIEWDRFQELRKEIESGKDPTNALMAFPEVLERMNSDPKIKALEEEVMRMSRELMVAKATGKPEKEIKVAETTLQAAQTDLESTRSMILGVSFQQEAATLKARFDRLRTSEADLLPRVKEARTAALAAAKAADEYETRAAEFRRVLGLLQAVSNGLEQMRIAGALAEPTVRVAEYPMIPVDADAAKPAAKP